MSTDIPVKILTKKQPNSEIIEIIEIIETFV